MRTSLAASDESSFSNVTFVNERMRANDNSTRHETQKKTLRQKLNSQVWSWGCGGPATGEAQTTAHVPMPRYFSLTKKNVASNNVAVAIACGDAFTAILDEGAARGLQTPDTCAPATPNRHPTPRVAHRRAGDCGWRLSRYARTFPKNAGPAGAL